MSIEISQLIAQHGAWFYPIVFLCTFFEGETIVLLAAFAAAQGLADPLLLLVASGLGSFAGDQCYFWVGRRFGARLLDRFPRCRNGVETALHFLERYNTGFILSFRFIYGVRNFSSVALGLSEVRWERFLWLNFAAAALWAACFVAVGYFLGHAFRAVLGDLARSVGLVVVGVVLLIGGGTAAIHRLRHRRHDKLTCPAAAAPNTLPSPAKPRPRQAAAGR